MSKKIKIITILINLVLISFIMSNVVFGTLVDEFHSSIDPFASGTGDVKNTAGKIVGIIQVVGTIVAVAMMIVLGIKYIMGSAEERAEYKKTMYPYIIGAVLIFAATNLTQVIFSWATRL